MGYKINANRVTNDKKVDTDSAAESKLETVRNDNETSLVPGMSEPIHNLNSLKRESVSNEFKDKSAINERDGMDYFSAGRGGYRGLSSGYRGAMRGGRHYNNSFGRGFKSNKWVNGVTNDVNLNSSTSQSTDMASYSDASKVTPEQNELNSQSIDLKQKKEVQETPFGQEIGVRCGSAPNTDNAVVKEGDHTNVIDKVNVNSDPSTVKVFDVKITQENIVMQQKYEDLRKLRSEVDEIWKQKESLIQVCCLGVCFLR